MILGGAIFLVAAFLALACVLRIPAMARQALAATRSALTTVRDKTLDDEAKERAMQAASLQLFGLFFRITLASVIAVGVPLGLLYLAQSASWLAIDAVVDMTLDWRFLLATSVLGVVVWKLTARRSQTA